MTAPDPFPAIETVETTERNTAMKKHDCHKHLLQDDQPGRERCTVCGAHWELLDDLGLSAEEIRDSQ